MSTQEPTENENLYFIDHESGAEMARLLDHDRYITKGMGGLLSERSNDFSGLHRVLDLGCGPGGWVQEVAFANPEVEAMGVDISQQMISYAQMQARVQGLTNAEFRVMDILNPLTFRMISLAWSMLARLLSSHQRPGRRSCVSVYVSRGPVASYASPKQKGILATVPLKREWRYCSTRP
jgi:SAM-dependent methyltransferase